MDPGRALDSGTAGRWRRGCPARALATPPPSGSSSLCASAWAGRSCHLCVYPRCPSPLLSREGLRVEAGLGPLVFFFLISSSTLSIFSDRPELSPPQLTSC